MICEYCGKEHNGEYGSGRFCSKSCAISFTNKNRKIDRKQINKKISEGLQKYNKEHPKEIIYYNYICEKCGKEFKSKKIKNGRHIHCNDCKRKVVHFKNIDSLTSIKDLSKRTISKIFERSNKGCSICGWNESTCDIHHIIPKSKGGNNDNDNLIIVCPNCHRIIHTSNKYSIDFLKQHSIENEFNNWKDFYHPSN